MRVVTLEEHFNVPSLVARYVRREAIARFHAEDGPGRDAGKRRLALRELLG